MARTTQIQLSDHFTYGKLFRFVIPSIVMMVFTSIYGVVDGLFVSNFVGKTPFAAINLIMPLIMIFGSIGFMFGTGGSALVAKCLGEGKKETANQYFSMIVFVTIISGIVLGIVGVICTPAVARMFGADENMLPDCILYGRILLSTGVTFMLQNIFQSFFVTAGKPKLGLFFTVAAGCTNMILDALLVAVLRWGVAGAAIATVISQCVGGLIPFFYFCRENSSSLRIVKTRFKAAPLVKACTNGSSEMLTNISTSLVSIIYNFQLIRLAGENGVAAYGVIMYVDFIFIAIYVGYSIGSAPIIGYHYGAGNHEELRNMLKKSLTIVTVGGILMLVIAQFLAGPLAKIFVGYDAELFTLTKHAFSIFSLNYLLCGVNIFASAFFTALNNGVVSAGISFLRTLVFKVIAVLTLPVILGLDGIWSAIVVAEALALFVSIILLLVQRKKYHY